MTDYLALSNNCLPLASLKLNVSDAEFGDSLQIVNPETGANLVQLLTSLDNSADRVKDQSIKGIAVRKEQIADYQYQSTKERIRMQTDIKIDKQKVRIASIIQEREKQRQKFNDLESIKLYQENKILEEQIQKLLLKLNQQTFVSQTLIRQISEKNNLLNQWRSNWYQKQHHYQQLCLKEQEEIKRRDDNQENCNQESGIKIVQIILKGSKEESTSGKMTNAHTSITDNLGFSFNKSCQYQTKLPHRVYTRQYIDNKRGSMSEAEQQINILMSENNNYQSLKISKDENKKNKSLSTQQSFEIEQLFRKTLPISMSFAPKLNQTCAKNMYKKIVPNTVWGDQKKQDIVTMRRRLAQKKDAHLCKIGAMQDKTNIAVKNKTNLKSQVTIKDWDKYKRAKIFNKSDTNKKLQQKGKQSGRTKVSTYKIDVRNMK